MNTYYNQLTISFHLLNITGNLFLQAANIYTLFEATQHIITKHTDFYPIHISHRFFVITKKQYSGLVKITHGILVTLSKIIIGVVVG